MLTAYKTYGGLSNQDIIILIPLGPFISRHTAIHSKTVILPGLNLNRALLFYLRLSNRMAPKAATSCNWVKSIVTDSTSNDFVTTGYLPKKEIMHYHALNPNEEVPQPKEGEVIVFTDHMNRGFTPPG